MGYACGITREARVAIHGHVVAARAALRSVDRAGALASLAAMWALMPAPTYDNWDAVDDAAWVENVLTEGWDSNTEAEEEAEAREAGFDVGTDAGLLPYLATRLEELEDDAANYDAAEAYCAIFDD